jgi:8-oxo-dGTP diphosphatase
MTLLLVRHAVALRRSDWKRPDHLRPLTPLGYRQADALPELLRPYPIQRILSSPFVRCVETVQPLAAKLGLPIEERPELAEGAGAAAAALVPDLAGAAVLCSHGDVLPDLLAALAPSVADDDELPCAKGSTWVVEEGGARGGRAMYLPPPA